MEYAPMQSRPATFARPAPKRCTPIQSFTKGVAVVSRWDAWGVVKTLPAWLYFSPLPMPSTRQEASSAPMGGRKSDIFCRYRAAAFPVAVSIDGIHDFDN